MKHYVVTGGAGFIGSALVRALLALGDGQVRVIDNLLTGHEKNLDEVRSRIAFQRSDIRDYAAVGGSAPRRRNRISSGGDSIRAALHSRARSFARSECRRNVQRFPGLRGGQSADA